MPEAGPPLTMADAHQLCASLFHPAEEQRFGLELEWPLHRRDNVLARPTQADIDLVLAAAMPSGGRVTFEPGGQVELSSLPHRSPDELFDAVRADERALAARLDSLGLATATVAVDDRRPPVRVLAQPRYAAMERFFAAQRGPGAWMMCNTASTQINISNDGGDPCSRWRLVHQIAPLLVAAFANSPGVGLDGTRWTSLRQGIWWRIDPARTRPVRTDLPRPQAWLDYALRADVLFVNRPAPTGTALLPGLSFGAWLAHGHELGRPTLDDLRYHLSTLFPPVRPRGWLELRVLDALPVLFRQVATLVVASATSADACVELRRRLPDTSGWWQLAARSGLDHPGIAAAAQHLFRVAVDHLAAVTRSSEHRDLVAQYRTDYVEARRAPGADGPVHDLSRVAPAMA